MPGTPDTISPIVTSTCGYRLTTMSGADRTLRGCLVTELEPPIAEDHPAIAPLVQEGAMLGGSEDGEAIARLTFTERSAAVLVGGPGNIGRAALVYGLSEHVAQTIEDNEFAALLGTAQTAQ